MATHPTTGTYPLSELKEFTVAEGAPDPRGWAVAGSDQRRIGTVEDLLVDLTTMHVRYLDVRLEGGPADAAPASGHVLLPVGLASTDGSARRVLVDLPAARAAALPAYTHGGAVPRGYEDALLGGLAGGAGARAGAAGAQYYDRPEFETGRFYGGFARGAGAGTNAGANASAPAAGGDLRVVVAGEEAVVTTRRVVKEILVIKRRRVVENKEVEYDLRTERLDVDPPARGAAPGVA